jgi:Uma2 family endonuclease
MTDVAQRSQPRFSVQWFRAFLEGRPDEERWELIDGVPVMMAPPTLTHQRIAGNVQRLLNEALRTLPSNRVALQRPGIDLGPSVEYYDPEPDIAVIDADASRDPIRRYANRFYLAAEVVSKSDHSYVESKRAVYMQHDACECVLTIEQDKLEVHFDLRTDAGWTQQTLTNPDDMLVLPEFGLRCTLADLYEGTALQPT